MVQAINDRKADTFLEQINETEFIEYLTDMTDSLRQMCKAKNLSVLVEAYGLALNLIEHHKDRADGPVTSRRMTG